MDSLICEDNIWKNDVEVCDIEEFGEEETTSNSNYLMERHGHDSLAVKDASRPSSELKYGTETLECTNSINERFIHILRQVSIAEHIRTVQSFYKDPEDDLTLVEELRVDIPSAKYTTEVLVGKITEGRTRLCSLSRLIFGVDSIEYLKSKVDLANIYALQGMWQQVNEHLASSQILLSKHESNQTRSKKFNNQMRQKVYLACRVRCIYQVLRKHASKNKGFIIPTKFLVEIEAALVDYFCDHLVVGKSLQARDDDGDDDNNRQDHSKKHSNSARKQTTYMLMRSMKSHFDMIGDTKITYLQVINFFRKDCDLVMGWQNEIESFILPQSRIAIELAFQLVDRNNKGVVNVTDLVKSLNTCTAATKVINGGTFLQQLLSNCNNMDIPPGIEECESECDEIHITPITLEETLVTYLMEVSIEDPINHMKLHIYNLLGVMHMFAGKLAAAETNLKFALQILNELSLETEMIACELYNSIAQLLILNHRQWLVNVKRKRKKDALAFLWTQKGQSSIRDAIENELHTPCDDEFKRSNMGIGSFAGVELRVKNSLLKSCLLNTVEGENGNHSSAMEAAFKYLVRSYEILNSVHGDRHPSVGAACLAVASVLNTGGKFTETREWLGSAVRFMEELDPFPQRAVAFARQQLASVLVKQNYFQEAIDVLSLAIQFYYENARAGVNKSKNCITCRKSSTLIYNKTLLNDLHHYFALSQKIVSLHKKCNQINQSLEHLLNMVDLSDLALGWDSLDFALYTKEAAELALSLQNAPLANRLIGLSLESHKVLFTVKDKRTSEILFLSEKIAKLELERKQ